MDTDELAQFRAKWKEELNYFKDHNQSDDQSDEESIKNKQIEKSLYWFKKGLHYERKSQPYLAVEYYRKAFKLNPTLEHSKELQLEADWLPRVGQQQENKEEKKKEKEEVIVQIVNNVDQEEKQASTLCYLPEWANSFVDAKCELVHELVGNTNITNLPSEILTSIFAFLEAPQIETCSSVCRSWYILTREKIVWKRLCQNAFSDQELVKIVENEFQGNWRALYIDKPRPRYDGIYISHNSYVRSGQTEGSYNQPLFKINYWRYLRFFPDGTVLSVCSPERPKMVVPLLNPASSKLKSVPVESGEFQIFEEAKQLLVRTIRFIIPHTVEKRRRNNNNNNNGNNNNNIQQQPDFRYYCFLLNLKSSSKGWHNRLEVSDYFEEKDENQNTIDTLIKPFKFIRVPDGILNPTVSAEKENT